ncbi:hypothetical protein PRVXH_002604 [Proteinivorax hydrogeniformans]|uniref:Sodium/calcium exchanger membrane region domain-containing protein n=1 Tax=Proteinivorax hydrogeniformans TaxID=1826727 RepID=A0AAU8HT45_9FIRM
MIWITFFVSAAVIILAGTQLSKNADIIAYKTGLSGALIGALLLPIVTSLPEIVTSAQSALIDNPDIALGNVFGSNMFNILVIAVVDVAQGRGPVLLHVKLGHILTAGIGMLLASLAAIFILVQIDIGIFGIGIDTLILAGIYLAGLRLLIRYDKKDTQAEKEDFNEEHQYAKESLKKSITIFVIAGVFIVISGRFLAISGDEIAKVTGLGGSFVGSFLVAITTSLPELVATFTAAKLGAFDMAIGNLLGANIMNVLIIFFTDLFYVGRPVLTNVSTDNAITALFGIFLTTIAIIGLIYRSKKSVLTLGFDSWAIIIGYIMAALIMFNLGMSV